MEEDNENKMRKKKEKEEDLIDFEKYHLTASPLNKYQKPHHSSK